MSGRNTSGLIPFTEETASERGRNGAKKANEKKKQKRLLREILLAQLDQQTEIEVDGVKLTKKDVICDRVIDRAMKGDLNAFETIRDTIGEKPRAMVHMDGGMSFNSGGLTQTLESLNRKD